VIISCKCCQLLLLLLLLLASRQGTAFCTVLFLWATDLSRPLTDRTKICTQVCVGSSLKTYFQKNFPTPKSWHSIVHVNTICNRFSIGLGHITSKYSHNVATSKFNCWCKALWRVALLPVLLHNCHVIMCSHCDLAYCVHVAYWAHSMGHSGPLCHVLS